jgi:hypothetical protein
MSALLPAIVDFQNAPQATNQTSRLAAGQNPQNLKVERHDWVLFRTVEGLQQKAGVGKANLRRVALKELADNALDTGAAASVGTTAISFKTTGQASTRRRSRGSSPSIAR